MNGQLVGFCLSVDVHDAAVYLYILVFCTKQIALNIDFGIRLSCQVTYVGIAAHIKQSLNFKFIFYFNVSGSKVGITFFQIHVGALFFQSSPIIVAINSCILEECSVIVVYM